MSSFAPPSAPVKKREKQAIKFCEPFQLPDAGNDELAVYITAIKPDAPFDYAYFDGVDFSKRVLPVEAGTTKGEGKHYNYRLPTKYLTEKQVKAIRKAAAERTKKIPAAPNMDFRSLDRTPDEPEFLPPREVVVGDYLILEKTEGWMPGVDFLESLDRPAPEKPQDEAKRLEENIYQSQSGKGKKK